MRSNDGTGVLTVSGQPKLNGGSINVNAGTLAFTNTVAASGTGAVSVTVSQGATLQLAGSASALTSATTVLNHGSAVGLTGGLQVTGGNQTVGVVTGTGTVNADGATVYDGDTVVSGGADLTATQILQNSLTINAGSTVTIAPSSSDSMVALPAVPAVSPSRQRPGRRPTPIPVAQSTAIRSRQFKPQLRPARSAARPARCLRIASPRSNAWQPRTPDST